jgi:hypothetical protein
MTVDSYGYRVQETIDCQEAGPRPFSAALYVPGIAYAARLLMLRPTSLDS